MPLYGFLIAAATASGFPFAGGGSLMGAQYHPTHAHPGAVVWAPRCARLQFLIAAGTAPRFTSRPQRSILGGERWLRWRPLSL